VTAFFTKLFGPSYRQRIVELGGIIVVTVLLIAISRLETRLYDLSSQLAKDHAFYASIFFYGIINLNVFLAVLLSFLVVRNIAKLIVERRRGVFGSKLRTKLVATLLIFALAPTVIVFYVSTSFINESFNEWFGGRVRESMQSARDAAGQIYLQDQRRLEGIARVAASKVKIKSSLPFAADLPQLSVDLDGFESEYGVFSVRVYDRSSRLIWSSVRDERGGVESVRDRQLIGSILGRFATRPGLMSSSVVDTDGGRDIVRSSIPLRVSESGELAGVVLVEERFDMPFLKSLQEIIEVFSRLKPGAQIVRVSYLILVTVMTLLIIFGAVWFGFRVARAISGPIQSLAEATREIALGNYAISLNPTTDDETGLLMKSFNKMTHDLESHRRTAQEALVRIEKSNVELERRRQYMEVVFKHIAAGVIAIDAAGNVTTFNQAARTLLGLELEEDILGKSIQSALGPALAHVFWEQVLNILHDRSASMTKDVDLRGAGIDLALFVAATVVRSIEGDDLGVVVVFDDATQRVKQQRVIAWREVASRIAHEIKNPITPIKLSAERLMRRFSNKIEGEDREVFINCVESILVQVDSLRSLVNEFGKFARLPAVKLVEHSVEACVSGALQVFKEGYGQIRFLESIELNMPKAQLDAEQMNRALVNLIGNAVDAVNLAHPNGGGEVQIKVSCERQLGKFTLEIADNGHGIPSEIRERVFDPYVSSKVGGTGLGLAITSQIITEHGGYIRLIQSGPRGTVFRIELPYDARTGWPQRAEV
jgi:two-component system, NtrC family, nitrogen regulation sensor histidine kinase NtrY